MAFFFRKKNQNADLKRFSVQYYPPAPIYYKLARTLVIWLGGRNHVHLYSWTSPKQPPWGPKKVTFVERFKQEWMYKFIVSWDEKIGRCREVAFSGGSTVFPFTLKCLQGQSPSQQFLSRYATLLPYPLGGARLPPAVREIKPALIDQRPDPGDGGNQA